MFEHNNDWELFLSGVGVYPCMKWLTGHETQKTIDGVDDILFGMHKTVMF